MDAECHARGDDRREREHAHGSDETGKCHSLGIIKGFYVETKLP
jgi:hypothetical protein